MPVRVHKTMDPSRIAVSPRAVRLVVAALTIFAVMCFAFAGARILENDRPTATLLQHPG